MSKNFKNDLQLDNCDDLYLGLNYKKIRVGIIGAGKVGFLKGKKFILNGSYVEVISKDFLVGFTEFNGKNLILNNKKYTKDFIFDKHLIIIAIDDVVLRRKIIKDCNELFKIFIDCSNSENGIAKIPYQNQSNNFSFAISTKNANPKMSILLGTEIQKIVSEYDNFEAYTYEIRCNVKENKYKKEILSFINTHEFKEIWEKGKANLVLELFFNSKFEHR